MAALEPSDAAPPRRVERGGYSEVDVRKALLYLLAHVEQGIAPPTPWFVAHKKLGVPAMYARVCCPSVCGPAAATPIRVLPCATPAVARARAFRACGPAPTRVLKRSLLSGTPAHSSRTRGRRSRRCQPTRGAARSPRTSCRERAARRAASRSSATRRRSRSCCSTAAKAASLAHRARCRCKVLSKVLVRCRRCSSILLFVVVIHVVVIAYRLSSMTLITGSLRRLGGSWRKGGCQTCQHASTRTT